MEKKDTWHAIAPKVVRIRGVKRGTPIKGVTTEVAAVTGTEKEPIKGKEKEKVLAKARADFNNDNNMINEERGRSMNLGETTGEAIGTHLA